MRRLGRGGSACFWHLEHNAHKRLILDNLSDVKVTFDVKVE
jgi:hypothetical protein